MGFNLHQINFEKLFSVNEVSGISCQNVGVLYPIGPSCWYWPIWKFAAAFPEKGGWGEREQCGNSNLKKS